jgi:hypothetical protein
VVEAGTEDEAMSALEEYRKFEVLLRFGSHVTQQDVDAVAEGVRLLQDKADAAIAELEADTTRLFDEAQRCRARIAELEAEAERLTTWAERSEQLAVDEGSKRAKAEAALAEQKVRECRVCIAHDDCKIEDLVNALEGYQWPDGPFSCTRWDARAEEGSEK